MMHAMLRLVSATVLSLLAGSAFAVNLLVNPSFPTNVAGWTLEDPPNSTLAWSPIDATGSPASGSALVTNTSAGPSNGTGIVQCVNAVNAGATYTFGGRLLFPLGQATTGSMQVGLRWRDGPGCTGAVVGSQPRLSVNSAQPTWVALTSAPVVAPVGTVSAQFIAFPSKVEAGGQLVGQFDDLSFDDGLAPPPPSASPANIPVLGPWTLIVLAGLLGLAGAWRRRR
jgi:exosortase sorting signal-containing protein